MIHPSYNELLDIINKNKEEGAPEIDSRYSLVIASARRARQLVNGQEPLTDNADIDKPLSVAVQELYENKVRITKEGEDDLTHICGTDMNEISFEDTDAPETEDAE